MEFLIKPRFRALNNALYFETDSLNALAMAEYNDKWGFYQRQYNVYNYMRLTQDMTFRLHYPEGTPFMWQPHNNCAWTPTGTLTMNTMEVTPCRAKINEQNCYDELINSTYKAALQWSTNPTVGFSQMGIQFNNQLVQTIMKNATLGARMTLTGGQLHDLTSVTFETGVDGRIEDAYRRTAGTCRGWIELCRDTAAADPNKAHMDGGASGFIDAADISSDGKTYLGTTNTVIELLDIVKAGSPTELQDAILEGGVGGFGTTFYPLFLVSPTIFRAIDKEWLAQKVSPLMNEPRITKRPVTVEGRTFWTYFIDEIAIVPISEISQFDRYVTGTSHFCYLTISGVIQLGGSFANIPVAAGIGEQGVSIMIQVSTDAEDYGTSKYLSHGLMATAINDTNYIAGEYIYAEPS